MHMKRVLISIIYYYKIIARACVRVYRPNLSDSEFRSVYIYYIQCTAECVYLYILLNTLYFYVHIIILFKSFFLTGEIIINRSYILSSSVLEVVDNAVFIKSLSYHLS